LGTEPLFDPQMEPCPHCGGTGQRVVPPPPMTQGEPRTPPGSGRRHGYEATYAAGCRCDLCRAAHREGQARRKRKAS